MTRMRAHVSVSTGWQILPKLRPNMLRWLNTIRPQQSLTGFAGIVRRKSRKTSLFATVALAALLGCRHAEVSVDRSSYIEAATAVEFPRLDEPIRSEAHSAIRPVSLTSEVPHDFWDITLEQTVQIALAKSKVFRDIGGTVLRAPNSAKSTFDPAVLETDPRFGPQAALSAFDATFASSLFIEKNDRALNNQFFGGGTRILKQDAGVFQAQINKKTPFGSEFSLRHNVEYDTNNAPGNAFPGAWDVNFEAEFRQSLLRGAGIDFGRIAGTSEIPGVYNGVLIARTNTDMSIAEFELAVRNFVNELETSYWNLYFAYRDLDAKTQARNSALQTWRRVQALKERGRAGGEADKEAEAREQYYRFKEDVENALADGVLDAERRLRYLMGVDVNSHELLRPADEPIRAPILFDWELSLEEAMAKRAELRRQKWMIKRRELELTASRNFLQPELDIVAAHRWRGFGQDLLRQDPQPRFGSAWDNFAHGDFQESQFGVELAFPFGNRQAHAGVRNAEFLLAREKAVLHEQEQRIVHDLSRAVADVDRAHQVLQTVFNRREAARDRVKALQAAFEADKAPLNYLLDAQRRLAAAETHYYRTLVEYNTAIRATHFEKGTLLEFAGIHLSEGSWPDEAYSDAQDRLNHRHILDSGLLPGHRVISNGPAQ